MRARNHIRLEDEEASIDMTPMLDVVFILLIFFIVTASFSQNSGVKVERPQAASSSKLPARNLQVTVQADGAIWVDGQPVDIRSLGSLVRGRHLNDPAMTVVVQADQRLPTGSLVEVMDRIRSAGVNAIAVATKPPE